MDDDSGASVFSSICDTASTQPIPDPETFPTGASTGFMPWPISYGPVSDFGERIECLLFRGGFIRRVRIATDVAAWNAGSVGADSTSTSLYANFVVAGEVEIGQDSNISVAKAGDVILYDRPHAVTLRKSHTRYYEDLSFAIFKNQFTSIDELANVFGNVIVLRRENLLPPLSSSLAFLADNMSSLSRTEVPALFNACASLLPVAIAHSNRNNNNEVGTSEVSHVLRALLDFVNKHISSADLSPHAAALHAGISVRYVHKLFAARKTTFRSYVTLKRLELFRKEMLSPSGRGQAISTLAYRCGFNDLSTFNRSFMRRYGVTPSKFRVDANATQAVGRGVGSVLVGSNASAPSATG